jgi:beta-N-acetylhexosaminidase
VRTQNCRYLAPIQTEKQRMIKKSIYLYLFLLPSFTGYAQHALLWADSVLQTMSVEEKIGQLFMIPTNTTSTEIEAALSKIKNQKVGGIIITGGKYNNVRNTVQSLVSVSQVPLLVSLSKAWRAGDMLDSSFITPEPLLLGALRNDTLVYQTGLLTAMQLKSMGVNMHFTPTLLLPIKQTGDTLYNFWGQHRKTVIRKTASYVAGLHHFGVLACAQQQPAVQSTAYHKRQSAVEYTKYDTTDLLTYDTLLLNKLDALLPTSIEFSESLERKSLMRKLKLLPPPIESLLTDTNLPNDGYKGLRFADMSAIKQSSKKLRAGDIELAAFIAGNHMLLNSNNITQAIRKIKAKVKREERYAMQLDKNVQKILTAKYFTIQQSIRHKAIADTIRSLQAHLLMHEVYAQAITVVNNSDATLPITTLDTRSIASLSVGVLQPNEFSNTLNKYTRVDAYAIPLLKDTTSVARQLKKYSTVIVGLFPFSGEWQHDLLPFLKNLARNTEVIIVQFSTPDRLAGFEKFPTLIEAYTATDQMPEIVAQTIFGALPAHGVLPIQAGEIHAGMGVETNALPRLGFALPEAVGMNSNTLEKIKYIAYEAINAGATPGCQIVVARKGKIIYQKSFGWLTYENKVAVNNETIYDLASITKVSATLQTTAFLHEKGMIDINKKMSVYLPELKGTNKEDFIIKDILTHQAGLWPFLPFWAQTMKDSVHLPTFYASAQSDNFPFAVADNLYAAQSMKDSLWQWIIHSKVREKPPRTPYDYRYSDMGFYMLQHLAERLLNQPIEDFLSQNLYEPLGASSLGYLPLQRFQSRNIAPTEKDKLFRKSLLTGYVHDQGAAMQGGVAGHAGLFGNALDLAKLGQLWLNNGSYGGLQYFKPETIKFFIPKQYEGSRRGLGWDKRDFGNESVNPTSKYASAATFGHTGFTGTCIWVDPEHDLVYIFLSNRVHPDMNNNKLLSMSIRPRIHDVVYESIFEYSKQMN